MPVIDPPSIPPLALYTVLAFIASLLILLLGKLIHEALHVIAILVVGGEIRAIIVPHARLSELLLASAWVEFDVEERWQARFVGLFPTIVALPVLLYTVALFVSDPLNYNGVGILLGLLVLVAWPSINDIRPIKAKEVE